MHVQFECSTRNAARRNTFEPASPAGVVAIPLWHELQIPRYEVVAEMRITSTSSKYPKRSQYKHAVKVRHQGWRQRSAH